MSFNRSRFQNENKPIVCSQCSGELTKREKSIRLCFCGYQICQWCLSKHLQSSNNCPRCDQPYSSQVLHLLDSSTDSQYSDTSSSLNNDQDRRQNPHPKPQKADLPYLQNIRIIQKNLVYVIGLSPSITDENMLKSPQLFGQYGSIKKVIFNNSSQLIEKQHSCCAYITFSKPQEALNCIMATDGCVLFGNQIRASFGTTKYCNFFLRNIRCTNNECMYLHHMADEEDCFTKKDMLVRQSEFYAKTHPCHADGSDVPMGKNLTSLPPLTLAQDEKSKSEDKKYSEEASIPSGQTTLSNDKDALSFCPSYLKDGENSVFGDISTSRIDYSCLLQGTIIERSFETSRVFVDDNARFNALAQMMREESIPYVSSSSSTSIDLPFLLQVHDLLKQAQEEKEQPIEEWDWRLASRSYSIDSNVSVKE